VTGRDDARAHPSVDELADLREGLLPVADEERVRAHLEGCDDCAAGVAAVDEVATALRGAAGPVAMPQSVARAIDEALRKESAARSGRTAQPTLPERVAVADRPRQPRRWVKPAFGWLAGAAAAVVIVGGIGAGLRDIGSSSDDNAGGAADGAEVGSAVPTPGSMTGRDMQGKHERRAPHLDPTNIRSYAFALATRPTSSQDNAGGSGSGSDDYLARMCPAPQGIGGLTQPVIWYGRTALLVVRREARVASVYSCDATPRRLYSAVY
jgi:hypothetical protein